MRGLIERDSEAIWHPYTFLNNATHIPIVRGEGAVLFDERGNSYIDGVSSWWVNLHGHCNPYIASKISEQVSLLEHVIFSGFTHEPAVKLAERLLRLLPEDQARIFFSDNGSTAVEVAVKMALQYWFNKGEKKTKVIAFENGYHGDTFGSMSVSGRGIFTRPFEDHLFEVIHIPPPTLGHEERCFSRLSGVNLEGVAAFIFEPLVMGAAGMVMYDREPLNRLIRNFNEAGVITIADEVMTGFGRTGKMFASEYLQCKPDIFCLSKGITGGFMPMGVTSCTTKIQSAFVSDDREKTFFHGHSYTGNPISCAAANASLDVLERSSTWEQIEMIGEAHVEFLSALGKSQSKLGNGRVLGTILALDVLVENVGYLSKIREKIYTHFIGRGILMRPLGNVVYVMPPYCIKKEELDTIYGAICALDTML